MGVAAMALAVAPFTGAIAQFETGSGASTNGRIAKSILSSTGGKPIASSPNGWEWQTTYEWMDICWEESYPGYTDRDWDAYTVCEWEMVEVTILVWVDDPPEECPTNAGSYSPQRYSRGLTTSLPSAASQSGKRAASGVPSTRAYHANPGRRSMLARLNMGAGWYSQWDKSVHIAAGGQRAHVTRGDGTELIFTKAADGNWQSQGDGNFRLVEYADPLPELRWTLSGPNTVEFFDARGRLRSTASPGEHYRLGYSDAAGTDRLEHVTDFRGRTLAFRYDAAGYVSQIADSVTGATTFAYEDGLMVAAHYPNGHWREFSYDKASNKVTYKDHKEGRLANSMDRGGSMEDALVSDTTGPRRGVAGFEKQSCPVPPPDPCTSDMRYEISVCIMAAEDRRNFRNTVDCWPLVRSHEGRNPEEIIYYEFLYNSCITSSEYTYLMEREACRARYPQCG